MGIEIILSEPSVETVGMLDKLCGEYGMKVAIHNHPKPSYYWNPDKVVKVCGIAANGSGPVLTRATGCGQA